MQQPLLQRFRHQSSHRRKFDAVDARRRAERTLASLGPRELGERRPDRLSGGEQRRVALTRALAPAPRLLLADEPRPP